MDAPTIPKYDTTAVALLALGIMLGYMIWGNRGTNTVLLAIPPQAPAPVPSNNEVAP